MQTFQAPWPLIDAFELADNAEEQLFQSLGIIIDTSSFAQIGAIARMSSQTVCSLCNQSFRGSSHIPQEPSWAFELAETIGSADIFLDAFIHIQDFVCTPSDFANLSAS